MNTTPTSNYLDDMNSSVIYGSIGAIIVLLLWLYLSATMMIMGAEFNSVLMEMKTARS